jgi:hypothetical protein
VAYAAAPTMVGVMNVEAPPHGILSARSTVNVKSLATTGSPLENFRPLRIVTV